MKLRIFLSSEGLEILVKGHTLYPWHFLVRTDDSAPENAAFLVEVDAPLPTKNDAIPLAVAALQKRKQEIYAEAEVEAQAVNTRLQELLAIEGPTA